MNEGVLMSVLRLKDGEAFPFEYGSMGAGWHARAQADGAESAGL
jgi:hypothetical protein